MKNSARLFHGQQTGRVSAGSFLLAVLLVAGWHLPAAAQTAAVPLISSCNPALGPVGAVVNIAGLNFDPVPGNNVVYFGAVQAAVTGASATNLVVTVPTGATYAPITETVSGLMAFAPAPFLPTFLGDGSPISSGTFGTRQDLTAGGSGQSKVVIADLDGDGKPDLVVANTYSHTVSVYRNISTNGLLTAGSFAPPVILATSTGAQSPFNVEVADVDGDGKLDIVATEYGDNVVSIWRNISTSGSLGSNSFAARVDFATGTTPIGVAIRDIDGDGRPDLVVANAGDGTVSILRNTGLAGSLTINSFAPKVDLATDSGCDSVAVGDLDGDGKPDVVAASSSSSTVSLLQNLSSPGSIVFAPKVDFATATYPLHVALVDVDGDGKLDLVVAGYLSEDLSVFRNTSTVGSLTTNSLAPRIDFALGGRGHSIGIGDLNGNGNPDLAVVTEENSLLSVFQNVSMPGSLTNSSLGGRVDFPTGLNPWGVAVGDLDGDGRPDIVFGNDTSTTISIYQNQTPFGGPPVITIQPTNQAVPLDGDAQFSVTASGTLALSYQWYVNTNNPVLGATNATLSLVNVQNTNAIWYSVVITNALGNATSSVASLSVIDPPTITQQPSSCTNLAGTTATFAVSASGTGPLAYQWLKDGLVMNDGGEVIGSLTATLTLTNVSLADVANYSVIVSNTAGSVTSSMVALTVLAAPVITLQPISQTNLVGTLATFTVTATGTSPLSYQWYFNGASPLAGATNATLTLTSVQTNQAGEYAVLATNASGSAWSSNAFLTVVTLPTTIPAISSFSPALGPLGAVVNIVGLNFDPVAGNNVVYFGAVRASVTGASATNLEVIVPAGATCAPITETVSGLTAYSGNPFLPVFAGGGPLGAAALSGPTNLATGSGPVPVAIGDLDGDGQPDLVVGTGGDGAVWVYRNIGTNGSLTAASFAPPVILLVGGGSGSVDGITLADVDGDGRLDIIVANYNNNVVSIFQNQSAPGGLTTNSFGARVDLPVGGQPVMAVVRDLDGDGWPEIISANLGNNTVSVLRNLGTSGVITTNSFAPAVSFATPAGGPSWLAVGDLDGDGKPDLATANHSSSGSVVSVWRNISTPGSVNFAARVDLPGNVSQEETVAIGDLDGDGKPDLVVGSYSGQTLSVYRNLSTPGSLDANSFAVPVDFAAGGGIHRGGIAIGDLDGDGKPDVAFATESADKLSVFRNTSTPGVFTHSSLGTRIDFTSGHDPAGVAIGDLDGDGRPDVVFANFSDSTLSLYHNVAPMAGPPVIVSGPVSQTNTVGTLVSFAVTASGTPPLNYQWTFNGTNVEGGTNVSLTLTNVQLSQAGNYAVWVTNLYGLAVSSNAVLAVVIPPVITQQPQSQTVLSYNSTAFTVAATGTGPLTYQWQLNGTNLVDNGNVTGSATTNLTLASVSVSEAGNYDVVVSSPYATTNSATAVLTVPETAVTMTATNAMSGSTLIMPILMNALGVENTFLASVAYDPTKLAVNHVQLGQATAGAYLQEVDTQTNNGFVGFAILLNYGSIIPAGTQEVAEVVFQALPVTNNTTVNVTFGDTPTARQVVDNNLNLLPAIYQGGSILLTPAEYAADVYPRFNGDHQLTLQDWLEEGRLVAGLDTPTNADEFLRADCAPRNAPDGVLTVADWVQAGRYALGLDPITLVTPPATPHFIAKGKPEGGPAPTRILQIANVSAQRGQSVTVPVQLVCTTNENAVGMTVSYSPNQLRFVNVSLGSALTGGRLIINSNQLTGKVGLAIALSPGATLPAGTNQAALLQFVAGTNTSGTVALALDNSVVKLEVADLLANSLAAAYVNGSVTLPGQPTVAASATGGNLQLSWPVASGTFQVQTADSPSGPWTTVVWPTFTNGANAVVTVSPTNQQQYFRLQGQ